MKKKIIVLILALALVSAGCSEKVAVKDNKISQEIKTDANNENTTINIETEVDKKDETRIATIKGITFKIDEVEISDIIGDRDSENYAKEDGEYFALNSEILKASDYSKLVIKYTIENNSDKAIGYTDSAWEATLQDGYKINLLVDLMDLDLKQVQASSYKNETVEAVVEKSLAIEELKLKYNYLDYNQNYWDDFGKIFTGEMNEEQYNEKYKKNIEPMQFKVKIK